jgi:phage-related protein
MAREFDFANAGAERDYLGLPYEVQREFGHALRFVQQGFTPSIAKTLTGFGDAQVQELRADDEGGTYRVVYTVRFEGWLYLLHAFTKKSRKGASTDKPDLELVRRRPSDAKTKHEAWRRKPGG